MRKIIVLMLFFFVAIRCFAGSNGICVFLNNAGKPSVTVVSNSKVLDGVDIGAHNFRDYVKNPLIVDVYSSPAKFDLESECSRSCFSLEKVKSECVGFSKYKGKVDIDPTSYGIGMFKDTFELSLSNPKAVHDDGYKSFPLEVKGVFHGGSMGVVQGKIVELNDFLFSRKSALVVTLRNFGDLPVSIGAFSILQGGGDLIALDKNNCEKKTIQANALCSFTVKTISRSGFPKKNGTMLTISFENDGLGDGNAILFFDKNDGNSSLTLRQGYSQ